MPRSTARLIIFAALAALMTMDARAASLHQQSHHGPHHLSLFVGATDLKRKAEGAERDMAPAEGEAEAGLEEEREDDTAATFALDYEYRLSQFVGLGAVVEQTTGSFDATTLLAVADIHLYKGFVLQVGPGVEFIENQTNAVGRIGGLYEFEFGRFTVSPQAHYDVTDAEDSTVFGIAFGMNF